MARFVSLTEFERVGDGGSASGTWFQVLEGPGRWLRAAEGSSVPAPEGAPDADVYQEIFAARDSGPLATSAPFVYAIEIDVAPGTDLDAFHDWYNGTHVPAVRPAGLLRGRRFRALATDRRFLATYDMADRHVLVSDALARVRGFDHFTESVTVRSRRILAREGASAPR